jgi:hypothetical protein
MYPFAVPKMQVCAYLDELDVFAVVRRTRVVAVVVRAEVVEALEEVAARA